MGFRESKTSGSISRASRSSRTGRFVSNAAAARWPGKTATERNPRTAVAPRAVPPVAPGGGQRVSGDPVTDEQRASAARIRMAYDKKRGRQTESWIKKLAQSK